MNSKVSVFGQLIYEWLSTFAPTYRGVLPAGVKPANVYLKIGGYADDFATQFIFPVQIYALNTTSYGSVALIADEIGNAIGNGGILLSDEGIRVKIEEQHAVEKRLLAGADIAPAGKTRLSAYGASTEQCRHTLVRRRSEVFQFHISLRSISFSAFCRTLFSAPTARRNARAMTMLPILPGCTLSHVIKAG